MKAAGIRTGGYVPLSTIDYPGMLAAVVFLSGCPWDCPYCHNPSLRNFRFSGGPSWPEILALLDRRRGLLEAVVFSGGEPTSQKGLGGAMRQARDFGFRIGLHTSGACPDNLAEVLPMVNWVGLDIKAPPDARYDRLVQKAGAASNFLRSLQLIRDCGAPFTLRTTVHPSWTTEAEFQEIQGWLAAQNLPPATRQQATSLIAGA